jgi:hypothetical protein
MRSKLIVTLGLSALLVLVAAQNATSSTITVTTANDFVQLTNETAVTYTGTGIGSNTISTAAYDASGSLTIIRSSGSLDYLWSATPDFAHTKGVAIYADDAFTLSGSADFQLTFTGSYLNGYLLNTSTNTYVEKFGYKSGNVGPIPDFTVSGSLPAGNYELLLNGGALPNFGPKSGEVYFVTSNPVPIPGVIFLLAPGLAGLAALRKRLY